jgi:hypothetical protein
MRASRHSIAGLMGLVALASVVAAALHDPVAWLAVVVLGTRGVLALAIVGVACRGQDERAWWLGIALFGWVYLTVGDRTSAASPTQLVEGLLARIGALPPAESGIAPPAYEPLTPTEAFWRMTRSLCGLAFASLGGLLASSLFGPQVRRPDRLHNRLLVPVLGPRRWRSSSLAHMALALGLLAAVIVGAKRAPAFSVGATLLLTWGVVGAAALGAVFHQGKRRASWLGAALFGASYMFLTLCPDRFETVWSRLGIDEPLRTLFSAIPAIEPGYLESSDEVAFANARIRTALERPIPIHFAQGTSLEDFVRYIRTAAPCADGKAMPTYVDPIGLQEAEKTMASSIALELDGVPLKTSLRVALSQLGMNYEIREGVLQITSDSSVYPPFEDPALAVWHCLLALVATGVGGIAGRRLVVWHGDERADAITA